MVIASSSSSSSSSSAGVVKFICSYGGRIIPRYPDGKLRYVAGETHILAVDRSVPFQELQSKLGELCGYGGAVTFRCQLPTEDLDALVTIKSDEDLANLIEEYDLASRDRYSPVKIRAFLAAPAKPPHTAVSVRCFNQIAGPARFSGCRFQRPPPVAGDRRINGGCLPRGSPSSHQYLVHHGNHCK